jgi:hypothetical protein
MNPALFRSFQYRMSRDQSAVLEDADLVGKRINLYRSIAGRKSVGCDALRHSSVL